MPLITFKYIFEVVPRVCSKIMSLDLSDYGGYDYTLVSPPPDANLICKICRLPSRNPHMTLCCGHVFCMSCISKVEGSTCCICRATKRGQPQYKLYKNKQVERDVWSLQIYCPNKEKGCEWQGELNSITKCHLKPGGIDGCQYEDIKCSNGCGKMIQQRHFTKHVKNECPCRVVKCPYCHRNGKHSFIDGEHQRQCPKLLLPCPNNCTTESICQSEMREHRNRCPLEIIQCRYYNQGCKEKMARKDQSAHDERNLEKHLALTTQALTTQMSITQELATLRSDMAIIKQQLSFFLKSVQFMDTIQAGGYV